MVINTTWAGSTVPSWEIIEPVNIEEPQITPEPIQTEQVTLWPTETPIEPVAPLISDTKKTLLEWWEMQAPEVKVEPTVAEPVPTPEVITKTVAPTEKKAPTEKVESVQDIKTKELAIAETERQQRTQRVLESTAAFDEAAKAGNLDLMKELSTKNPDLKLAFATSIRKVFGNKSNIEFFGKFNWASNDEMKSAAADGTMVIWSTQYNLLPEAQRRRFEQFNKLNQGKKSDFSNDNQNVISLEDITAEVEWLFSFDLRSKIEESRNNPELLKTRQDLENQQNDITEIDDALEVLEDDLEKEFPGMPRSFILAEKAKRAKNLIRSKNTLVNQYNAKLGTYKDMKSDIDLELQIAKFEDVQQKEIYQTSLWIYKERRSEMRADEKLKFLEDNRKLASETQFARQKELATFNNELREKGNAWGQYIDDGKGNLSYVKNGKEISVLTGLGKTVASSEDENYTWETKENSDGSYSVFWLPKKGQNVLQKNFAANWEPAVNFIKSTGTWTVTSYGWTHDKFQGLDIDGNVGDPITSPLEWEIIETSKHPWYGNTMVVRQSDDNLVRYSHLEKGFFKEWDKIGKGAVIGTMWNSWNVLKLDWTKPTAQELAQWFGSHLDIVTTDPDGNVRSSKETESYLNNVGLKKDKTDVLSERQQIFFNQQQSKFKSDPQVKAFESALSSGWDLIKSLDSVSWPWDVAAIFQFMKTLDPASVVRESEFAVAGNSAGISSKPELLIKKISTWELLTDVQRKEFWRLAFEYINNKGKLYDIKYNDMERVLWNAEIWGSNLPTRITDLIKDFKTNDIKDISWGKTYTSPSGFTYDTTWTSQKQDDFFTTNQ